MKKFIVIICLSLLVISLVASAELAKEEIQEVRKIISDELKHVDKRLDDMRDHMDKRFNDLNNRIGTLIDLMLWGFGVLVTGMMALVGFVIWDRRTALAPAIKKNQELEERQDRIEKALKELAIKEPDLADILKQMGL